MPAFGQRKEFTSEQLDTIRQLRAQEIPMSWTNIAKQIGTGSADSVHAAVDEEYREKRNMQSREKMKRSNARKAANSRKAENCKSLSSFAHYVESRRPPSEEALEERARAFAAKRTITAEFCGDPLPGRSALDKRNSL